VRAKGVFATELEFDVAFHDVDMVAVVWHGHYLRYLENVRWALMDRLGYGLQRMLDSGVAWPIVELHTKYLRVARFGDRLLSRASLVEWESRLVINYLITDTRSGARVLRARTVQVAVDAANGELQFACPADFLEQVAGVLAGKDQ
jgi:acyl-CoA thioester hydrolase